MFVFSFSSFNGLCALQLTPGKAAEPAARPPPRVQAQHHGGYSTNTVYTWTGAGIVDLLRAVLEVKPVTVLAYDAVATKLRQQSHEYADVTGQRCYNKFRDLLLKFHGGRRDQLFVPRVDESKHNATCAALLADAVAWKRLVRASYRGVPKFWTH